MIRYATLGKIFKYCLFFLANFNVGSPTWIELA